MTSPDAASRLAQVRALIDVGARRAQALQMLEELGASQDAAACAQLELLLAQLADLDAALHDMCPEGDEYELTAGLPQAWLELRFCWTRWNLRLQYQTMTLGTANAGLMVGGAVLGELLEALERCLDAESLLLVHKIAEDPFGTARGSAQRTERLFERMTSASDGGNRAVEAMLLMQDQILRLVDTAPVRRELDKAIETVVDEIGNGLLLSGEDLAPALEAVILRTLGTAAVRVVPQVHGVVHAVHLPPDVASLLLESIEEWLRQLGAQALTRTPAQRVAAGCASYVTIDFQLVVEGDDVVLTIRDDADGMVHYARHNRADALRNLRVQVTPIAGGGNTLELRCSLRRVNDYLVIRAVEGDHDGMFAVPLRAVESIEHRPATDLCVQGTRIMTREGTGTIRVVDIGDALFAHGAPAGESASYVVVHTEQGPRLALRVHSVEGIRRGSLRSVPDGLEQAHLRGFIQSEHQVIGVVDLQRLSSPAAMEIAA